MRGAAFRSKRALASANYQAPEQALAKVLVPGSAWVQLMGRARVPDAVRGWIAARALAAVQETGAARASGAVQE